MRSRCPERARNEKHGGEKEKLTEGMRERNLGP